MNTVQLSELDLRLLRVLDVLLETHSVSRAAAALGVTPSAVSHALRALRRTMGDPLFVRSGSSLRPTPLAAAIQPALRSALVDLRRVLEGTPAFAPAASRRVFSVVMPDYFAGETLPAIIRQVGQEAPLAGVRLWPLGPHSHAALASGELDLILTAGHSERSLSLDRDMMRTRVDSQRFVCIVRKDHPAPAGGAWTLPAYAALPHLFISLSGAARSIVDDTLEAHGHARRVVLSLPIDASVGAIVARTDLVATVPEDFARWCAEREALAILAPPVALPPAQIYLWWHARFQQDPAHVWWRAKVMAAVRPART